LVTVDPQLFWLNRLNTELCAIGHRQRTATASSVFFALREWRDYLEEKGE
jgi:hypothetical protein